MAITMSVDTLLPEAIGDYPETRRRSVATSQLFAATTLDFLSSTQQTATPTGDKLEFIEALFILSDTIGNSGAEAGGLGDAHFKGALHWLDWFRGVNDAKRELTRIKPSKRLEFIVTMARRDVFAQQALNNVYTYLDWAVDFIGIYDTVDTKPLGPDPEIMAVLKENHLHWGFGAAAEALDFGIDFKTFVSEPEYVELHESLKQEMLAVSSLAPEDIAHNIRAAIEVSSDINREVSGLLFAFFYFNHLYPPEIPDEHGSDSRETALIRLGIPSNMQYIDLAHYRQHQTLRAEEVLSFHSGLYGLVQTEHVGGHFSHMNTSYVRTIPQKMTMYKPQYVTVA